MQVLGLSVGQIKRQDGKKAPIINTIKDRVSRKVLVSLQVLRKYRETESMESLNMHLFKVTQMDF